MITMVIMNNLATIDSRSIGYLIYQINLSSNLFAPRSVGSFDILELHIYFLLYNYGYNESLRQ